MCKTRLRINGMSYLKTTLADGTEVYEPPLPSTVKEWFARGREDMLAGHAPKLRTDSTFNAGRGTMRDQFKGDEPWLNRMDKEYRKQTGGSLPADGVWMGQLADSQFDARAVVKSQGEVNRLIKRRLEKLQREAEAAPVRLAEDLVQEKVVQYRGAGDTSPMPELREKIIETHGAKA